MERIRIGGVGEEIKRLNLSRAALARRSGLSATTILRAESGQPVSVATANRLLAALGHAAAEAKLKPRQLKKIKVDTDRFMGVKIRKPRFQPRGVSVDRLREAVRKSLDDHQAS